MEAVDEEGRRAERCDPAGEHCESIREAAALESNGIQHQLANAQQGKN